MQHIYNQVIFSYHTLHMIALSKVTPREKVSNFGQQNNTKFRNYWTNFSKLEDFIN